MTKHRFTYEMRAANATAHDLHLRIADQLWAAEGVSEVHTLFEMLNEDGSPARHRREHEEAE